MFLADIQNEEVSEDNLENGPQKTENPPDEEQLILKGILDV